MPAMTRIPSDLAAFGLPVELVPGWETRSAGSFAPAGVICHWTAGPMSSDSRPSLNVVINGRPGLSGPLCNVYLDRRGVCVVVAAGRANHAGAGSWRGLVGNSAVYGIEAEAGGPNDWTADQRRNYPRLVAALLHGLGRGAEWAAGHSEWAGPRKTDINGYTMDDMRRQVAGILADPGAHMEDDMSAADIAEMQRKLSLLLGVELAPRDPRELTPGQQVMYSHVGGFVKDLTGNPQAVEHVLAEVFANSRSALAALTALASKPGAEVDVKALAAAMAPLVSANAGALTDADLSRVAVAVADEQARRLES